MKISLKIAILIFIIVNCSNSQSSWQKTIVDSAGRNFYYAQFKNSQGGYIISYDACVYKTTNLGSTWTNVFQVPYLYCYGASFVNALTGFISTAISGNPWFYQVRKTTDGGANWQFLYSSPMDYINNLYFINEMTGFRSGGQTIYKTTDGGSIWTAITTPSSYLKKILFLDTANGYYLDEYYYFFKTSNGGFNWNQINLPSGTIYNDFFYTDSLNGYLAGTNDSGLVLKTTDGGYNWHRTFTSSEQINIIKFYNKNVGYMIGDSSKFYRTSNAGINWVRQYPDSSFRYNDFSFINIYTGWIVGNRDLVLKTTNGGSTFINNSNNKIISSYFLFQNYPNPFNPITNIKFDVSKSSNVILKIFDVTGREISTLINEKLNPGTYETQWNAIEYSSGIYFYRIEAGDYRETKKMILIK